MREERSPLLARISNQQLPTRKNPSDKLGYKIKVMGDKVRG